ncbi:hypothetical protein [Blastococcus goldschmidtiae]|uniref:Small secreted domain n=1 Tax=Blastococcus goldschmidtiae TaxID=3075546 RepID=A0ABU2K8X0_9ACTN|nr:hypothetical protein [Blastococcus sp. DSM 46792]MDT0276640.1 hypothetical protein [Blastococcus sp. DSM 46792]
MNVWMKRGLQTALFTGGLLAAGTGIASADDDIAVTVPVTVTDNALAVLGTAPGTTPAEIEPPAIDGTVGADLGGLAIAVPIDIGGNAADVAELDVAQPAAAPASGGTSGSAGGSSGSAGGSSGSVVDADVPVTATGNAIAVFGDATAGSSSTGTAPAAQPEDSASLLDVDAPVLVCGNAVGVLGDASADCAAPAPAAGGSTDGALLDVDAPVTVCGIAVGVLGNADADCTAPASGAGGSTDGTGPVVGVDAPISVCGIGVGILGGASTTCTDPAAPATPVAPAAPVEPASGQPGASPGAATASTRESTGVEGSDKKAGGAATGTDSALAYTGIAAFPVVFAGLLAVAFGIGLTLLSRRRAGVLG